MVKTLLVIFEIWGVVSAPAFAEEDFLTTSDGVRLFYEFSRTEDEKGAVVLLHGHGMSYNEWNLLKPYLHEHGWSTFALDFRGHGASVEMESGKKQLDWQEFDDGDRWGMLKDIQSAVEYLRSQTKEAPLWLIGSSLGANLALNYAARDRSISGIILISPGLLYVGVDSLPALSRYGKRPVLLVSSADDPESMYAVHQMGEKAKGPKKLVPDFDTCLGNFLVTSRGIIGSKPVVALHLRFLVRVWEAVSFQSP